MEEVLAFDRGVLDSFTQPSHGDGAVPIEVLFGRKAVNHLPRHLGQLQEVREFGALEFLIVVPFLGKAAGLQVQVDAVG